ncbi:MAG: hypothetical protein GX639_13100 [Fibrobacter sp.]|nr:hypothetical protein [Fibrobacter sp.]
MNNHLIPEKIKVPQGVTEMKSLPEQNKFALVNGRLEFAIANLNKNGNVNCDVIQHNFPRSAMASGQVNGFYSDVNGKIFWIKEERSIVGINSITKKTFDPLFAFGFNSVVNNPIMENNNDEIIVGEVYDHIGNNSIQYLIGYDCKNDKLGERGKSFNGFIFPIGNKEYLYCETIEGSMSDVRWHICDLELNIRHNKLTDELTKKKIATWGQSTPVSPKKRMMIGCLDVEDKTVYFSVRWNNDMSDVRIEPLLLQKPQNGFLERRWLFSDDGCWLTANFSVLEPKEAYTRIFFNIDDKYPQGVSLPVFGEATENIMFDAGCFVNHSDLGPLYLDKSPESDEVVNVYRLNDVYKVLANMAIGK